MTAASRGDDARLPTALASPSRTQTLGPDVTSNPNFDQAPTAPSSSETTRKANDNTDHSHRNTSELLSNELDRDESSASNGRQKPKAKRNSSSISSSLRRLLSLTFGRNPRASSSSAGATSSGGLPPKISESNSNSNRKRSSASERDTNNSNRVTSSETHALAKSSSSSSDPSGLRERNKHSGSDAKRRKHKHQPHNHHYSQTQRAASSRTAWIDGERLAERRTVEAHPSGEPLAGQSSRGASFDASLQTSSGGLRGISDMETATGLGGPSAGTSGLVPLSAIPSIGCPAEIDGKKYIECPLCVLLVVESSTPALDSCRHRVCLDCMQRYLLTEINHSRLNITCPICSELLHPNTIKEILQNEKFYLKYENFMLRRVLAAEPDARWCPAPDCGYVVLATGCASCPKLVCAREGCNTSFCYHCKQEWHPNQTCSAASIQRNKRLANAYNIADFIEESSPSAANRKSSKSSQQAGSIRAEDIKECPVCSSRIIKMNDGSCNHMTCSICETNFCWLCMKEISDLHYFSPSGCTFWGKKPWSRKKKLLWQLGMLVGAPICIILIAGIAVPAIVIGIPVWAARKLHNRLERKPFSRYKKNAIITGGVLLSFVVSPIVSAVALAVGIPILLGYVYGVVPLSLCRSSGGCLSAATSLEDLQQQFQPGRSTGVQAADVTSIDTALSHKLGDPSIGETSLYMSNISLETNSIGHVTTVEREDRESASNAALAGSMISSNVADDGNSTRALAGSIMSKESGYTLVPAEVHNSSQQQVAPQAATQTDATHSTQSSQAAIKSIAQKLELKDASLA